MSKNADALPNRTKDLVPLTRKTFGHAIDLHGDANSSYDPPQAIELGRMLEEYKFLHYEEPCQFDDLEATKRSRTPSTSPLPAGSSFWSSWVWIPPSNSPTALRGASVRLRLHRGGRIWIRFPSEETASPYQ
jgi:hypothetical protein